LDNLAKLTKTIYNDEIKNGIPPPQVIRTSLNEFLSSKTEPKAKKEVPDLFTLIHRFISGEIKNIGKDKSQNTLITTETPKTIFRLTRRSLKESYLLII
jgi:hypothetical protein